MPLTPAEKTRRYRKRKYAEWDALPRIPCACGCGETIPPINRQGKTAKYKHGHNPPQGQLFEPGHIPWNKGKPYPTASKVHKGKKVPPEQIKRQIATRRAKYGGAYRAKRGGWKLSPETCERIRQANLRRDLSGSNNPMYGKGHLIAGEKNPMYGRTGPLHPAWRGGVATLPYGIQFTRKFKRLILQRDKYTCQRCGKTRSEVQNSLQVHHIDHDKMNNDPMNLLTVCCACNIWFSYHRDEALSFSGKPLPS